MVAKPRNTCLKSIEYEAAWTKSLNATFMVRFVGGIFIWICLP
jgi:hypothetical protein